MHSTTDLSIPDPWRKEIRLQALVKGNGRWFDMTTFGEACLSSCPVCHQPLTISIQQSEAHTLCTSEAGAITYRHAAPESAPGQLLNGDFTAGAEDWEFVPQGTAQPVEIKGFTTMSESELAEPRERSKDLEWVAQRLMFDHIETRLWNKAAQLRAADGVEGGDMLKYYLLAIRALRGAE